MPFANIHPDFETFFEPTRLWLFGKPFPSIAYVRSTMSGMGNVPNAGPGPANANEFAAYDTTAAPVVAGDSGMPPRRIERKLRQRSGPAANPVEQIFARIYSFAFEGHYYKLPRPLLFLVSGLGAAPNDTYVRPETVDVVGALHFNTKFTGIEGKDWQFSDDIRVWAVDRKDLAVCLDVEIGNYQEILLNSMIAWNKGSSRGDMSSRGDLSFRGDLTARGDMASRGDMSFRGDMIGPHQNR